jgi:hypothetical protein
MSLSFAVASLLPAEMGLSSDALNHLDFCDETYIITYHGVGQKVVPVFTRFAFGIRPQQQYNGFVLVPEGTRGSTKALLLFVSCVAKLISACGSRLSGMFRGEPLQLFTGP